MIKGTHMAGATNLVDDLAVSPEVPPSADAAPEVLPTAGLSAEMAAQLAVVLGAAGAGGLSGVDSERALRVVEAVETVKAWADSVSVEATAVLVAELESEHADLAPDDPTPRQWRRFLGSCRSAAAREIQVATGLPISACQRRVWLSACEPERAGPVREAMRRGKVSFARAVTLAEKTAHLDGFLAAAIAARVLRPLTGPDGLPLPGAAPLSQATFNARLHRQLVLHHGLVGQAERTYQEALKARCVQAQPNPEGTGSLLISGDGPRIAAAAGRVDQIARRLRQGGDARTLAQLRADVATDLLPVHTSPLETRHGTRLAQILNPDIPLPGHPNIFEHIDWAQALAPATPQPPPHTWATTRTSQHQPTSPAAASRDDAPPPF